MSLRLETLPATKYFLSVDSKPHSSSADSRHPGLDLEGLMRRALGQGADALLAREEARKLMGLDELNWTYFFYLYEKKRGGARSPAIRIHEEGVAPPKEGLEAFPLAIAPP